MLDLLHVFDIHKFTKNKHKKKISLFIRFIASELGDMHRIREIAGAHSAHGPNKKGLEIVRLGIPGLGTWRKQEQGFDEKGDWPEMALRIGLLRAIGGPRFVS